MHDKLNNQMDKLKRHTRWLYLLAAVVSFGAGGAIAVIGNNTDNPLLIVGGFVGLASGVLLFKKWRGEKEVRVIGEALAKPANCLVISKNYIKFDHIEEATKLFGLEQKCYNDGKHYHVHRIDNGDIAALFELPDDDENERYYDPTEMANVVTMPSNKKYFTWSASLMQKISIGLMAIVIAGEIIGLIALE